MRRRWALAFLLIAGFVAGCKTDRPVRASAWLDRFRRSSAPSGPDVVQLDVALVERPVGDTYINRDLWTTADEQVVALDRKAQLEDNGFRIGQIGGITPAGLQSLLTSEGSCVNPRRIQLHAGNPTTLSLGPTAHECCYQIEQDGQKVPVTLARVRCTLEVVPMLAKDGRTKLTFTPVIQHGDATLLPRPVADSSGVKQWMFQEERPTERYPSLSWEVSLAPNEYVVIGARFEKPATLGHQCFIRKDEPAPVQRLLVIRTGRQPQSAHSPPGSLADEEPRPPRSPSLACQATLTAARGVAP